MFEIIGRFVDRAAPLAKSLANVAHEHGIALWVAFGTFLEGWTQSGRIWRFRQQSRSTTIVNAD